MKQNEFFVDYYHCIIVLYMYEIFQLIVSRLGNAPLCNGRADRAPHICGKCFILCWRCTSLIFTMLLCSFLCWVFTGDSSLELKPQGIVYALVLIFPTAADGVLQYAFHIESTNLRRIVFGVISGIGLWLLASWLEVFIA